MEPSANTETFEALRRSVERAEGFALLIARVNLPAQQRDLASRLAARLAGVVDVQEIALDGPVEDLVALLAARVTPASDGLKRVVSVRGLEHSLPSSALRHPLLNVLNMKRELLQRTLPHPLVLWLPEYAVRAVAEGAPDLWAWRSAVLDFTSRADDVDRLWETERPGGSPLEYDNLSAPERRERLRTLTGLLHEYDARPNADTESLVDIRTSLLDRIARLHLSLYAYDDALSCYDRWRKLAVRTYDAQDESVVLHQIGVIHERRGDLDTALDFYQQSLVIKKQLGNRGGEAIGLHQIAMIHGRLGDLDSALRLYRQSLEIARQIGDRIGEASTLHQIGVVHQRRGDLDAAFDLYQQSLEIERQIGSRSGEAGSLHQIAMLHGQHGNFDIALGLYRQSLDIAQQIGDRGSEAAILHQIGRIREERGDLDTALDTYRQSLEIAQQLGSRSGEARTLYVMGMMSLNRDNFATAFADLTTALKVAPSFETGLHDAIRSVLRRLREGWGASPFDAAWREEMGEAVPTWLTDAAEVDTGVT